MEAKLFGFLEIIGVGYKVSTNPQGFILYLKLGFNHKI
jgi:ribosomal protein L6P/L9E